MRSVGQTTIFVSLKIESVHKRSYVYYYSAYIGKTKNTLHERFYGSNGHLNPRTANSPLLNHMCSSLDNECGFELDSMRILDSSSVDYRLRIIESVYLKYEKQTLNTQEYSFPLKLL